MDAYKNMVDHITSLPFSEKLGAIKSINDFSRAGILRSSASLLSYSGYLKEFEEMGVYCDTGEHYVYLWKHAWGDPFYVGCGKNSRWKTKNSRCDDFYLHLDAGDAIVYMVLDGVDEKTARLYEKYVSVNLTRAGYTLANGDNNLEYMSPAARERFCTRCDSLDDDELTQRVQSTVLRILNHDAGCDYRVVDAFLMEYGTDYFSRNHWLDKQEKHAPRA